MTGDEPRMYYGMQVYIEGNMLAMACFLAEQRMSLHSKILHVHVTKQPTCVCASTVDTTQQSARAGCQRQVCSVHPAAYLCCICSCGRWDCNCWLGGRPRIYLSFNCSVNLHARWQQVLMIIHLLTIAACL